MRVLHILDSLASDGAQTSYLSMVPHLIENGAEVTVVGLAPHASSLAGEFRSVGAEVVEFDTRMGRLETAVRLRNLIRARRPEVVHSTLFESDICSRIALLEFETPLVTTLANVSYGPEQLSAFAGPAWKLRLAWGLDRLTARRTTLFHAVAHHVARDMGPRLGVDSERIRVVGRGRDDASLGRRTPARRAHARQSLGLGNETLLLAVGRHEVQKGLDTLMHAMPEVLRSRPDTVLVVAGRPGGESGTLEALSQRLPRGSVRLLGARRDVPELHCAADAFVFPSRWEGMPGALIEAMALETPIVASDIGPNREILPENAGRYFAVDDAAGLSDEVLAALEDDDSRPLAARARFTERHTIRAVSSKLVELYDEAVHGIPRHGRC